MSLCEMRADVYIRTLTHPRKAIQKTKFHKNNFTDSPPPQFFTRTDSANVSGIRS
jgi:hypothetical protein